MKLSLNLKSRTNQNLLANILGSYVIKGLGILCSLISMPLFIQYFNNQMVLGVWFTMLSVLNWILVFDMGIGNGLRNHLTKALAANDFISARKLVSSAYIMLGLWTIIISIICCGLAVCIDWNVFLNISTNVISPDMLSPCVIVCILGVLLSFFLRIISSVIYSIQRSAITNLISFLSQLFVLLYLFIAPKSLAPEQALLNMTYAYALCCNVPLLLATIVVFGGQKMKNIRPDYKHFERSSANKVLSLGVVFLILQILYMIISVTDSWFITKFYDPSYAVDYQIYYKPFSFMSMLFMLALTPLWSAITKAYSEQRYAWIKKLQRILYMAFICLIMFQVLFLLLMPSFFSIWLGKEHITFDYFTGICFSIYSTIFIWISIQSTLVAGMGRLRVQLICYIVAVVLKITAIVLLYKTFTSWLFVVVATCIALLPYCLIQPICVNRDLKILSR